MSVAHLSVFGPHIALEKWRVEKDHKNNKENVVPWFPFFSAFLELSILALLCLFLWLSWCPWPLNGHYRQVLKGQFADASASPVEGQKKYITEC